MRISGVIHQALSGSRAKIIAGGVAVLGLGSKAVSAAENATNSTGMAANAANNWLLPFYGDQCASWIARIARLGGPTRFFYNGPPEFMARCMQWASDTAGTLGQSGGLHYAADVPLGPLVPIVAIAVAAAGMKLWANHHR